MQASADHVTLFRPLALRRLLLGVDFADASASAQNEAGLLARTFGAELRLAHVLRRVSLEDPDAPAMLGHIEGMLERSAKDLEADDVRVVRPFLLEAGGDPSTSILRWSDDVRADLIVLGAGAKSTLDRLTVGSTAEKVVRSATCPVWLTRPGRDHGEIRKILCAVDGSPASRQALAMAAQLARTFGAELVSVSVVPVGGASDFEQVAAGVDLRGVDHRPRLLVGDPAERILESATTDRSDLLVVGSKGRTGVARVVRGNTAETLLRKVPCSILTVRSLAAS